MAITRAAGIHGADLLRQGYSVEQVVRDYGDVCQSVTELASEQETKISTVEFGVLNRCLDDAIAEAVTTFGRARQVLINEHSAKVNKETEDPAVHTNIPT
jgi:hypothetical protein